MVIDSLLGGTSSSFLPDFLEKNFLTIVVAESAQKVSESVPLPLLSVQFHCWTASDVKCCAFASVPRRPIEAASRHAGYVVVLALLHGPTPSKSPAKAAFWVR